MFPFDIEDDELVVEEDNTTEADYEIDFTTGKLTGRILTGKAAIIQRAKIILATDRYFYPQYSWDHGSEYGNLIGKNYDTGLLKSEIKRMTVDALSVIEEITGIEVVECFVRGDKLTAKIKIETVYGGGEINV